MSMLAQAGKIPWRSQDSGPRSTFIASPGAQEIPVRRANSSGQGRCGKRSEKSGLALAAFLA